MRHLKLRGGTWSYVRRVPVDVSMLDGRAPAIQKALGTADPREARLLRDKLEREDNRLWQTLRDIDDWQAAIDLQNRWGFSKMEETDHRHMTSDKRLELVDRALASVSLVIGKNIRTDLSKSTDIKARAALSIETRPVTDALTGRASAPDLMVSGLPDFYLGEIIGHTLEGKSPAQRERTERWPRLAARHFVEEIGDRCVDKVSRTDAIAFRKHLIRKMKTTNPKTGRAFTADAASREIGILRKMLAELSLYMAWPEFRNPFADINFKKEKTSRMPIPTDALQQMATTDALSGMSLERRALYFVLLETGARLSEVCNLRPDAIRLDVAVPHIVIEGTEEREIKTASSRRRIPLVGLALEAAKKYPSGWPNFFDQENRLSAALGKYLKEKGLVEGRQAPVHGLRHAMKDRLRAADVRPDLIDQILGHGRKVPVYGEGFSLEMVRDALLKIALPFDKGVLD
ncbi:DUF6538 domain-containing protein [Rhizobium alvei]